MARRRTDDEELPFSLDSFLDIVANLVGILIRLIVMVGLTVRSLPPSSAKETQANETKYQEELKQQQRDYEQQKANIEEENRRRQQSAKDLARQRQNELTERQKILQHRLAEQHYANQIYDERMAAIAERWDLIKRYQQQSDAIAKSNQQLEASASEEATILDRELSAAGRLEKAFAEQKKTVAELLAEIAAEQRALDQERLRRQTLDEQLAELREQWALVEKTAPPPKLITHFGASVATRVEIEERHFRCLHNKIAATHLEELLSAVYQRAESAFRNQQMLKAGEVGPIGGFRLQYTTTNSPTTLQSAGQSFGRKWQSNLERFELLGENDELGETESAALARDSEFHRALARLKPRDQVITLWVYPDSFAIAKAIETELHGRGFAVALRPIPHGKLITGSPAGSVSEAH